MKFVPKAVTTGVARTILLGQKNSPQLLFASGLLCMGATVVLACKATLRVEEVLDKAESDLEKIQVGQTIRPGIGAGVYTERDVRRDKAVVYGRTAGELLRLYAPAIACGALTVAALAGSHNILNKRNAAITAAYGSMKTAYDQYRDRVREELGEERENEIYNRIEGCEFEDETTGKKVKGKRIGPRGPLSPYARLFDEFNKNYSVQPDYNFTFLRAQQNWVNQLLHMRGHVMLNDVYDTLGLDRTPEGAVVGWVRGNGDDYIDFGIFNDEVTSEVADFMLGREKAVWLDFNVDGVVYKLIGKESNVERRYSR